MPGQPDRVTRLAGVSFLYVKAEGGVTSLAGMMFIRASINMAANQTTSSPASISDDFIFKNDEENSFSEETTEEVDSAGDNLSMESDYRAELLNQFKVLPETTTK